MPDTLFTAFAFAATGGTATRTMPARLAEIRNVKEFGATGNGSTDDTAAIQAAMDAAWLDGSTALGNSKGNIVYFPAGVYVTTAPLTNTAAAGGHIRLVGANMESVTIRGTVTGFIINCPDDSSSAIVAVENMRVVNDNFVAGSGAVRVGFTQAALVDRCYIQGYIGLDMGSNTFNSIISNCKIGANFDNQLPGTVGLYTAQNAVLATSILGYDTAIKVGGTSSGSDASGPGFAIVSCRTETCKVGIHLGRNILGNGVGCGGVIQGLTTERCETSVYVELCSPLSMSGCTLTGTVGPGKNVTTTTWAANVATVNVSGYTLDDYGWTSGTRLVNIQSNSVSGYNITDGLFVTGTYVNSTRFTYPLVIANPGAGSGGVWSFKQQYGLRLGTGSGWNFSGVSVQPLAEIARIDMGSMDATQVSFNAVLTADSTTWVMPPATKKCVPSFSSCDQPALGMVFADLPGQASVKLTTALQGMTYYITDGNQATAGSNVTAGGGANKSWVVYNGTNWIRGAA